MRVEIKTKVGSQGDKSFVFKGIQETNLDLLSIIIIYYYLPCHPALYLGVRG